VIEGRSPGDFMPHRPPALLVGRIERFDGAALRCGSAHDRLWHWSDLLEGAAQCAGLLAGLQPGGPRRSVIAEYRDVALHVAGHPGAVRFEARLERRVLRFWRCRVEVRDAEHRLLLAGAVTVAPDPPGR
jgi:hypothetical protein